MPIRAGALRGRGDLAQTCPEMIQSLLNPQERARYGGEFGLNFLLSGFMSV